MDGRQKGMPPESDVVVTSRVRLARNLKEFPFPGRMNREQGHRVLEKVKDAVFSSSNAMAANLNFINIQAMNLLDRQVLVEKHLISPDLAETSRESGAIISKDESISILINEEDHIRVQCLFSGAQLDYAWQLCSKINALMEEKIDFAFHSGFGFLTSCPTNTGTGIRASVMLHLPALVMTGYIRTVLEACGKLGVAVRGLYGEHSEAAGNMFQISNQVTLGQSEEEIVAGVNHVVSQIITQERTLRDELYKQNPYRFEDRVFRSFGLLVNARIMSSEESLKLLSDVKLGVDMGILKGISGAKVNETMQWIQPGMLQKSFGKTLGPDERDIKRAELIRKRLTEN